MTVAETSFSRHNPHPSQLFLKHSCLHYLFLPITSCHFLLFGYFAWLQCSSLAEDISIMPYRSRVRSTNYAGPQFTIRFEDASTAS